MPDPIYNILIVDDDSLVRRLISSILTLKGHHSEEAKDGIEALAKFSKGSFDGVITDVMMPRMNGIELTRELLRQRPTLPIMVITGYCESSIDQEAILAGASAFIGKPFSTLDFLTQFTRMMLNHGKP